MHLKFNAEARGITEKAEAMKLFDGVGREHEEFKLRLNKDRDIELAEIRARQEIAGRQAEVLGEAMKHARIDIVGGETQFFDRLVSAVAGGKAVDRLVQSSTTLSDVKQTFFNSDPEHFQTQLKTFVQRFGLTSEDLKNLSISAAVARMLGLVEDEKTRGLLHNLLGQAQRLGLADKPAATVLPTSTPAVAAAK
ncbi:MAG: hypothetical protein M5U12_02665 [Verrucomicrobia bacterium]|nr:hypothetical protein [Verrucomicrobiota bacterium]